MTRAVGSGFMAKAILKGTSLAAFAYRHLSEQDLQKIIPIFFVQWRACSSAYPEFANSN